MREKFSVGDRVKIKGDCEDFTENLDGMLGTIVEVMFNDCQVVVDGLEGCEWYIWNDNTTKVYPA